MAPPYIQLVSPSAGVTLGGQLVEIRGFRFRLRQTAAIGPRSGPRSPAKPTVRVIFGDRVAPHVSVISQEILRVVAPKHPPSMWVYEFGTGKRVPAPPPYAVPPPSPPSGATYVQAVNGDVDITVQNLDDAGQPIPGESYTAPAAYTFRRPRLDVPGTWERLLEGLSNDLSEIITPNVAFNPSLDYDPDTGGLTAVTGLASLPGIGLLSVNIRPSETVMLGQREVTIDDDVGIVALQRRPLKRDMRINVVLVSDTPGELLSLAEIFDETVSSGLYTEIAAEAPDDPPHRYSWFCPDGVDVPERTGRGELLIAQTQLVAFEVTSLALTGADAGGVVGAPSWLPGSATQGLTRRAKHIRLRVVPKLDE